MTEYEIERKYIKKLDEIINHIEGSFESLISESSHLKSFYGTMNAFYAINNTQKKIDTLEQLIDCIPGFWPSLADKKKKMSPE